MQSTHIDSFLAAVPTLSASEVVKLYLDAVRTEPALAPPAALGLREKARAGEFDDASDPVGLLSALLEGAPDAETVAHLAKALAAFGRQAAPAAPILTQRVADMRVTCDLEFWALDGCIWALGFIGSSAAHICLERLAAETPNRAMACDSIYEGGLSGQERSSKLQASLDGARALLAQDAPGTWRQQLKPRTGAISRKAKKRAWSLR